jgi:flagellar hook-associated protein 1 FlgK
VALTSPSQLAVASPVLVEADPDNSGTLEVESLYRPGGQTPPGGWTGTTIEFVSGGYTTDGGTTVVPFTSGQPIEVDGFRLTLRGAPTVGDVFTVRPPAAGETITQNAGNGQALLALRDAVALDGYTLSDGYIPVFSAVSSSIQSAKSAAEFSSGVAEAAESARANQAGVNLDEEAARLLQFQQAYQASAKFLQTAQSLFDTLLQTFS